MKNKVMNLFGNNKVAPNMGVKYSKLLESFIAPFQDEFSEVESFEEVISMAMLGWNFGNMKIIVPADDFDKLVNIPPENGINIALMLKMIDYKVSKFKKHTNFIISFDLKETSGDPILSVITQSEEDYMMDMLNAMDKKSGEHDFEENYINRHAIIIKPLQPFIEWVRDLYPDKEHNITETNIYLVNEDIGDLENWLRKKFDKFFMLELEDWHLNKKEWPQRRNYKMFKLWFQVDVSEMIYDLEKAPVLKIT